MASQTIMVKPLSVNKAWQGRRFKTKAYKSFEKECMLLLKRQKLPPPPYVVVYEFGFSNNASDVDNPTKMITDVLATKFRFNDKHIKKMVIEKVIVPKGKEYIRFEIQSY